MFSNRAKNNGGVKRVRLRVGDLRPGMFVCGLDHPWLSRPFQTEGFEIKDQHDIEALTQYCEFVFVDPLQTKVLGARTNENVNASFPEARTTAIALPGFKAAEVTREQTLGLIRSFIEEIRSGKSLDVKLARDAVAECLRCLLTDLEPMMFLTRLRNPDEYNVEHAYNVCVYSLVIGRLLGLDRSHLENLGTCAMLHDMGKVIIPEFILNKRGKLNAQETLIMHTHTTQGRDILMSAQNVTGGIAEVAYGHHENLDGTGYPRGVQGFELNMNSKVVAVVDKYDAISSMRPYRRHPGDHLHAVSILNKLAKGNKIHGKLTSIFLSNLGFYPSGSIVELSSGEIGLVLNNNSKEPLHPKILVLRNENKDQAVYWIDLAEKRFDCQGRPYRIVSVRQAGDSGIDFRNCHDSIIQAFA